MFKIRDFTPQFKCNATLKSLFGSMYKTDLNTFFAVMTINACKCGEQLVVNKYATCELKAYFYDYYANNSNLYRLVSDYNSCFFLFNFSIFTIKMLLHLFLIITHKFTTQNFMKLNQT